MRLRLWIKAIWLFIWFKPFNIQNKQKEYNDRYDQEKDEMVKDFIGEFTDSRWYVKQFTDSRWYVKPRILTWILFFPIFLPFILLIFGLSGLVLYYNHVVSYNSVWINKKENLTFIEKLDILLLIKG